MRFGRTSRAGGPALRAWSAALLAVWAGVCLGGAAHGQAGDAAEGRRLAAEGHQRLLAGQYGQAVDLCTRALAIQEREFGPDHLDTAASLHDLAEAYRGQGDPARALPLAKRALEVRQRRLGRADPITAESLNDLGLVYLQLGDCRADGECREALPLVKEALTIRRAALPPDSPEIAESLNNLAVVYRGRKRYGDAEPLFEEALAIKTRVLGADDPRLVTGHMNLAALYLQWGDEAADPRERDRLHRQANERLQAAQAILARRSAAGEAPPADRLQLAAHAINLANVYWKLGDVGRGQAGALLRQAATTRAEVLGDAHPDTIETRNLLAAFYRSAGAPAEALALYRSGLAAENEVIRNVLGSAVSDEQKLQFLRKSRRNYWAALSLIAAHFAHDEAAVRFGLELVLQRKAAVLDAQSRANAALARGLSADLRGDWERLQRERAELSSLLLSGPVDGRARQWRAEVRRRREAINTASERLAARSPAVAADLAQRNASAAEVARALPSDGALVELVRVQDWDETRAAWRPSFRYLAFVLAPDGRVTLVDLGDAAAIDAAVTRTRNTINDGGLFGRDLPDYIRSSDERLGDLYERLLRPLAAALGGRRRLVIGPDGELNRVPFDALRSPAGRYVVEDHVVAYVTSGRDLVVRARGPAPAFALVLVANPAFDARGAVHARGDGTRALRPPFRQKFGPLPGTREEAELIRPLVIGDDLVLMDEAATESAVTGAASPRILHVATHGFFLDKTTLADLFGEGGDGGTGRAGRGAEDAGDWSRASNPMVFSGLALAGANHAGTVTDGYDGILTALEVSGMGLHGTDLVVLSACETALGEIEAGEGVYGLRRAFALAGAHHLVMSLWPVDDETTRDLMVRFYRAYVAGASVPDALHAAELETIAALHEKYQVAPVNLWAPFIAQGPLVVSTRAGSEG